MWRRAAATHSTSSNREPTDRPRSSSALTLALALSAIAFAARSHQRRALACAILAVLTKEVALLVLIGWYLSNRSRRTAIMVGASTAAILAWAAMLRLALPADHAGVNE